MKLFTKLPPDDKSFSEYESLMKGSKVLLYRHTCDDEYFNEVNEFMKQLIAKQDSDGFWRLILSEDMPYDAKVYYWKYPTILFTATMIRFKLDYPKECTKLEGFHETFVRALDIVERGRLTGHGFDSFNFRMDALELLLHAGVMRFINQYPETHKAFNQMILQNKGNIQEILSHGESKYCSVSADTMRRLLKMMETQETFNLFVYGSLMRNSRKGNTYLGGADFIGDFVLPGYALYDLDYYPGIVEDENEKVKGELYSVTQEMLDAIDVYEGEGSLYRRLKVLVHDEENNEKETFTYVYNRSVSGKRKIDFCFQPWFEGITDYMKNFVWYACYGSNLDRERFMKYILGDETGRLCSSEGCRDKTPPRAEKQLILNHPIYFANQSRRWDNRGIAFLDTSKEGLSYCKMYLITQEQFSEIAVNEGGCYDKMLELGHDIGILIKSFTHSTRYKKDVVPACAYIDIIVKGLCATYPDMSVTDAHAYLYRSFLTNEHKKALSYLRAQEHGISIARMSEGAENSLQNLIPLIEDLKAAGIIRQDGRSIREGIAWNAPEAVYYTVPDKRESIDAVIGS